MVYRQSMLRGKCQVNLLVCVLSLWRVACDCVTSWLWRVDYNDELTGSHCINLELVVVVHCGAKKHQNVFRHNFRKSRRILNKFGRLLLKWMFHKAMQTNVTWTEYQLRTICWNLKVSLYSFLQAFQMKVLVDYSTHCSTTRSSFSFDLTSCSVSLRGILMAEYKILYGINVASQAADDHVPCILQRTLIPYKILYSAKRMPPKLTEQLVRSKEKLERVVEQWVE